MLVNHRISDQSFHFVVVPFFSQNKVFTWFCGSLYATHAVFSVFVKSRNYPFYASFFFRKAFLRCSLENAAHKIVNHFVRSSFRYLPPQSAPASSHQQRALSACLVSRTREKEPSNPPPSFASAATAQAMSCGTKEAIVFTLGLISGTGTTLYVWLALSCTVAILHAPNWIGV